LWNRILLLLAFALIITSPNLVCSQQLTFSVTAPTLAWGQISPIVGRETAVVWTNVTSPRFPVTNVTLYYILTKGGDLSPSESIDRYRAIHMNRISGNIFNGTYEVIMQTVENDTRVWGFARALNDQGDQAQSSNQQIYYAMTPNPQSSKLELTLYLRHVDPKTMRMVMTVYGRLINAHSYGPEILRVSYYTQLEMSVPEGKYQYSNRLRTIDIFYSAGHPELYPFDGYNYTFEIFVPDYLNDSRVWLGGYLMNPHVIYPGLIPEVPEIQSEHLDNSAWNITSEAQFVPASRPYLRVTFLLERRAQQVNYSILYPVMALYALLGCSVLLRGEDGLRNRLLVYLNVFVFSYGFQTSVRNLWITPLTVGFSMIDRMVLALVPSTGILAVLSIVAVAINSRYDLGPAQRSHVLSFFDIVGISLSGLLTFEITRMVLVEYTSTGMISKSYSAFNMGFYGASIFALLSIGIVIWLVLIVRDLVVRLFMRSGTLLRTCRSMLEGYRSIVHSFAAKPENEAGAESAAATKGAVPRSESLGDRRQFVLDVTVTLFAVSLGFSIQFSFTSWGFFPTIFYWRGLACLLSDRACLASALFILLNLLSLLPLAFLWYKRASLTDHWPFRGNGFWTLVLSLVVAGIIGLMPWYIYIFTRLVTGV